MHEARPSRWRFITVAGALVALGLVASSTWQWATGRRPEPGSQTAGAASAAEPDGSRPLVWSVNQGLSPDAGLPDEVRSPVRVALLPPPTADRAPMDAAPGESSPISTAAPLPHDNRAADRGDERERPADLLDADKSPLERQPVQRHPDVVAVWPLPGELVSTLRALRHTGPADEWAGQVLAGLQSLHSIDSLSDEAAGRELQRLKKLAASGIAGAAHIPAPSERAALLRGAYALDRRVVIWLQVHEVAKPAAIAVSLRDSSVASLTRNLRAVQNQVDKLRNGESWREYLLLDRLDQMASHRWSATADERSKLAREILNRIDSASLTSKQRRYFEQDDWKAFTHEMRRWVSEPVDYQALLDDLELLENSASGKAARRVAHQYQILRWSPIESVAELGDRLNTRYRNANVRTAISAKLVNRFLPAQKPVDEKVNDTLLGGRMFGRSRISTQLRVVLVPDASRWRIGLEASGHVDSKTQTKHGPARFFNAGRSRYLARKLLVIDRLGIHTEDAEAAAVANADLTGMETDFDGIPLVNFLVRAIARQQYDSKQHEARWRVEDMLAGRVQTRFDREVSQQISETVNKFRSTVQRPLEQLGLEPQAIDLRTTQERLIARYRLASADQLGAYTPRPQAPSDSWFSSQIHESVLNNTVACLALSGHRSNLRELFRQVAAKFHVEDYQVPDDVPEDVTVQLADDDPIMLRCSDQRIHVTLRIARLSSEGRRSWRDFEVRAFYQPLIQRQHVYLVRDGYIRLKGKRLSMRDQVALRGIFSKVFAQHPDIDLLNNMLVRDQRLADLQIRQFVIRDGWIGVALSPGKPVRAHVAAESFTIRG